MAEMLLLFEEPITILHSEKPKLHTILIFLSANRVTYVLPGDRGKYNVPFLKRPLLSQFGSLILGFLNSGWAAIFLKRSVVPHFATPIR